VKERNQRLEELTQNVEKTDSIERVAKLEGELAELRGKVSELAEGLVHRPERSATSPKITVEDELL